LNKIAETYEMIIEAGVYRAESIRVAEAAKVIENSQRDINIAFMNELSIIFDKMGIDTKAVLAAAGTKWNFLNFTPGLVGGHCIGVDPYYLTYKAEQLGYHSQIILSGRKINDDMGKYVAEQTVKQLIKNDCAIKGAKVAILGITFKEDCPDVRNTKVVDVVNELEEYGIQITICDPVADQDDLLEEYGVKTVSLKELTDMDAVIVAVGHDEFKSLSALDFINILGENKSTLLDIKGIYNPKEMKENNLGYWRL
jgi:UDP-N-acetyl-D-galactosamine dehydrogenase